MRNNLIFKPCPYRDGSPDVVYRIYDGNTCVAAQHSNRDQHYVGAHVYEQERGFSFVPFREGAEPEVRDDLKLYGTARLENAVPFDDGTCGYVDARGLIRDAVGNAVLFAVGGIFILLLLS